MIFRRLCPATLMGLSALLQAPPLAAETLISLARPGSIQTVPLTGAEPLSALTVPARVIADPRAIIDINANISGQVQQLFILPGSHVAKGDPVATVTSPDFIFTQRSYLALLANDEQQDILSGEGNLLSYMADARDNLRWWGMTDAQIDHLEQTGEPIPVLSVTAPDSGIVTEVLMRPGEIIDAGDRTMQSFIVMGRPVARMVRDEGERLIELQIYPGQLGLDAQIRVTPDAPPLPVTLRPPQIDPVTRQATALAELGDQAKGLALGQMLEVELIDASALGGAEAGGVEADGVEAGVTASDLVASGGVSSDPVPPAATTSGHATSATASSGVATAATALPAPATSGHASSAPTASDHAASDASAAASATSASDRSSSAAASPSAPSAPAPTASDASTSATALSAPAASPLWLPSGAVLGDGLSPTIFVERGPGSFARLPVTIEARAPGHVRIAPAAVRPGDRVVLRGKTLLEGAYRQFRGGADTGDHHDH